jgi:hypothetical protein
LIIQKKSDLKQKLKSESQVENHALVNAVARAGHEIRREEPDREFGAALVEDNR